MRLTPDVGDVRTARMSRGRCERVALLLLALAGCGGPAPTRAEAPRPAVAKAEEPRAPRKPPVSCMDADDPATGPGLALVRLYGAPDTVRQLDDLDGLFLDYESGIVLDGLAEITAYAQRLALAEAARRGVCVAVIMDEAQLAEHEAVVRTQIRPLPPGQPR
jgi:hypothetical protein